MKKNYLLIILLCLSFSLTGCSDKNIKQARIDENIELSSIDIDNKSNNKPSQSDASNSSLTKIEANDVVSNLDYLTDLNFDGATTYVEVNNNTPLFSNEEKTCVEPFEIYSELDSFGRCGVAYANICKELMPTEERGEIGMIKPSGWHTVKYAGIVEGNYLYNRCHLIGFQLAGENANEKNLITGTRYFNVDGMLPFENQVADYVHQSNNHVLYRVTPIYKDNNLVANGVLMEAYSVEDKGMGVSFCVYCFNAQPGIYIDYATGDSEAMSVDTTEESTDISNDKNATEYVLNVNSMKIHNPNCEGVKKMSAKNKEITQKPISELESMGYSRCGICNP